MIAASEKAPTSSAGDLAQDVDGASDDKHESDHGDDGLRQHRELGQRVMGIVSVGLNAIAFVKDT